MPTSPDSANKIKRDTVMPEEFAREEAQHVPQQPEHHTRSQIQPEEIRPQRQTQSQIPSGPIQLPTQASPSQ